MIAPARPRVRFGLVAEAGVEARRGSCRAIDRPSYEDSFFLPTLQQRGEINGCIQCVIPTYAASERRVGAHCVAVARHLRGRNSKAQRRDSNRKGTL